MDGNLDPTLIAAETRFDEAVARHQAGDLQAAIDGYREVVRLAPRHKQAYNNLGTALKAQRQFPEAIVAYQKAIEADPDYAAAIYNLGSTYLATGQLIPAFACFRNADTVRPNDPNTIYNLALIAEQSRLYDYADGLFQRVIALAAGHIHALAGRARCLGELGRSSDALGLIEQVLALAPGDVRYLRAAGEICLANRDWQRAQSYLQRCLDLAPNALDNHMALANALMMGGQYAAARTIYEGVLRDVPDYLPAHVLLSRVLHHLGLHQEADHHAAIGKQGPGVAPFWLSQALLVPPLPANDDAMQRSRDRFFDCLDHAESDGGMIDDPTRLIASMPFFFAYQGRDDLPIIDRLAKTLTTLCPNLAWTAPHCAPGNHTR